MYRVIIVDDDPMVRFINRSFVEQNADFRVVSEFSSGRETLNFLSRQPVDLMILEANMPGYSGLDLLRDVRARRIDIDVILITAANDTKTLNQALRLGAIDYLVKPFKPARFQQTLEKYSYYMQALGSDASTGLLSMDYRYHPVPAPGKGVQDAVLERLIGQLKTCTKGCSVEELAESVEISRVTVRRYMKYLLDAGKVTSTINYNTGGTALYHLPYGITKAGGWFLRRPSNTIEEERKYLKMALMTGEQYIESIRNLKMEVYMFGKKVESPVDDPILRPSLNSVRMTYDLAQMPEYEDLMTVTLEDGRKINRFTNIHRNTDDLIKKVKMQRLLGQQTAACFQRCVGMDAFNAVYSTTFETDKKYGTKYHDNFVKFMKYCQDKDLTIDGAMTDPKGDRSLAPHAQPDPDMFLRVVERRPDGIVVRGAKAHQTGVLNSHEVIVMPTQAMRPEDKDYAVAFAVPMDTPGLFMIIGRQSCDTRKLEGSELDVGNSEFGGVEALTIFDDVFVPNDRIFLNGEVEYAGMLVERFAGYHRQSYGGCKVGVGDVLIGAAAVVADYNGAAKASHVKDKLIEMTHLNETLYACGIACSAEGHKTESGNYMIDLLLANVCKQNVTRFPYEIVRLAEDIAGGIMVTAPSEKDFRDPKLGKYVEKYLKAVEGVSTEDRLRILRLIENLALGSAAVGYRTESMHGAGSPQAQRIMIARQGNLEMKKQLAKKIAHIKN